MIEQANIDEFDVLLGDTNNDYKKPVFRIFKKE